MVGDSARKRGRPRKGERPVLTAGQLQLLAIDAADAWKPLPAAQVARRLGFTRAAISKWRKDRVFRERLQTEVENRISAAVCARLDAQAERRLEPRRQALQRLRANRAAYVSAWVRRRWAGPTVSPFDGQTYSTREALFDHYLEHDALPAADVEAAVERAERKAALPAEDERQRK